MNNYLQYYQIMFRRAFKETVEFFEYNIQTGIVTIIACLITGAITLYYFGLPTVIEQWVIPISITLSGTVIFFIAVFLYKWIQVPVLLYKELGGFDDSSQKVKLIIVPDCSSSSTGWLTFRLYNYSNDDILECYAELVTVTKDGNTSNYNQKLMWSSEDSPREGRKNIIAGGHVRVDLAAPNFHSNGGLSFTTQNGIFNPSAGSFQALVKIHGVYNKTMFVCEFYLDFTYESGKSFTCIKNGQEIKLEYITR